MKVGLLQLIRSARRRLLTNALAVAGAYGASAAMAMAVLVLLAGTDIVAWRWVAAVSAATFAAGIATRWRRGPSLYETAQLLDRRLHLADTLSTALFYWVPGTARRGDEETRCCQREQARRAAETVDLRAALPVRIPRPARFAFVALALLAAGVALLRYRADGRLDLHRPVTTIQSWILGAKRELAKLEHDLDRRARNRGDASRQDGGREVSDSSGHDEAGAERSGANEAAPPTADLAEKAEKPGNGDRSAQRTAAAESRQQQDRQQGSDNPAASGEGSAASRQQSQSSTQSAGQPGTGSSLLAKLSDSLANLASALKSQPGNRRANDSRSDHASGNNQRNGNNPTAEARARGEAAESQSRAAGAPEDSSSPGAAVNAMSDQSDPIGQHSGSGAGSNDGNKDVQLAKQLEAMGKISVILGKRSQNVTGNATVEVASGRSVLKTPYQQRDARHAAVESPEERDWIPMEFQGCVQQYFRELRKRSGAPLKKNAPIATAGHPYQ